MEGNIGLGRKLAAVIAGAVVLWLAPNAVAANQLLETLNVDPANTAVTTGTVQLTQGTEYQLQVSGTFTLANGFGQSYEEDALYCFGDTGFATPQCTPTPQRLGDFYVGSGSSSLKNIDAYQEPGGGGPQIGYGITHRYNVNFYPPANGPLTAGGPLAYSHCKSGPNPCTTTISGGPIQIQIYGAASTPPPSLLPLTPPPAFCPGTASDFALAVPAEFDCQSRDYLQKGTKGDARDQLREDLRLTLEVCGIAFGVINRAQHVPDGEQGAEADLDWAPMCLQLMKLTVASLAAVKDPPDSSLRPLGMLISAAHAAAGKPSCPHSFSAKACQALLTARARYLSAVAAMSSGARWPRARTASRPTGRRTTSTWRSPRRRHRRSTPGSWSPG